MSLKGSLKEIQIPDMLQFFSLQKKSGFFNITSNEKNYKIYINKGFIEWLEKDSYGLDRVTIEMLYKKKKLPHNKYDEIVKMSLELQVSVYQVISDYKIYDIEIFKKDMKETVYEIFNQIVKLEEGEYEFIQPYDNSNLPEKVKLGIEAVLMENMRQMDEWQKFMQDFKTMDVILNIKIKEINDKDFANLQEKSKKDNKYAEINASNEMQVKIVDTNLLRKMTIAEGLDDSEKNSNIDIVDEFFEDITMNDVLTHQEKSIMYVKRLINGERTLGDIIKLSDLGEYETVKIAHELLMKGYIELIFPKVKPSSKPEENIDETFFRKIKRIIRNFDKNKSYARAIVFLSIFVIYILANLNYRYNTLKKMEKNKNINTYFSIYDNKIHKNIEIALAIYYIKHGEYPSENNLVILVKENLIDSDILLEFINKKFTYTLQDKDNYIIAR